MGTPFLGLFEGFGIELEYMIVDRDSLDVRPLAETVLRDETGAVANEVVHGPCAWSNELTAHVIELKTHGPAPGLAGLDRMFHGQVTAVNSLLAGRSCCLMPGAMHPWMPEDGPVTLWPHENRAIYEAFNRIFDCRGHGWSNLQSCHINLPFKDDEEFGRLHGAIRLILPLLPALAASSPFVHGGRAPYLDYRLEVYRHNARAIPEVTGRVIPEAVFGLGDYEREILAPLYRAIAPHDPDGILQEDWLNARGAIVRMERQTIEIRVLDVQECPRADLAITSLVVAVLRALVAESWSTFDEQAAWSAEALERFFLATRAGAGAAFLDDPAYLRAVGYRGPAPATAGEVWRDLRERIQEQARFDDGLEEALDVILEEGALAERLVKAAGPMPDHERLHAVYGELCQCLAENRLFRG